MKIDPAPLQPQDIYRLLTGIVVPRPIAWVTTISKNGIINLAPFSCFTFVSSNPPMVGINVGLRAGDEKDTGRNILEQKTFVVNIGADSLNWNNSSFLESSNILVDYKRKINLYFAIMP